MVERMLPIEPPSLGNHDWQTQELQYDKPTLEGDPVFLGF